MQHSSLITVDGEKAGGQVVRNSIALAALAAVPLKLVNMRASRQPPGLQPQHLRHLRLMATLCNSRLDAQAGGLDCTFWPQSAPEWPKTAATGSLTLLVQTALPSMLFAAEPRAFTCLGATDVEGTPPIDELFAVFLPILSKMGVDAQLTLKRRGFDPDCGGEVTLAVERPLRGRGLRPLVLLEQGRLVKVDGRAFATPGPLARELDEFVACTKEILSGALPGIAVDIMAVQETAATATGQGSGMSLVAVTDTGCRYGATYFRDIDNPGTPKEAAKRVIADLAAHVRTEACVDEFVQDQLVMYMALANGRSEVRVGELTAHTKGAVLAAESLLPCRFSLHPDGKTSILRCEGAGLLAPGKFAADESGGARRS